MDKLIDKFVKTLLAEGSYALNTCTSYQLDLFFWLNFCRQKNINSWQNLDNNKISTCVMQMRNKTLSPSTIRRRLSALRAFFEYLIVEKKINTNYARNVVIPKINRKLPSVLSYEKINKLLSSDSNDFTSSRNNTIIAIFYTAAVRLSELVGLDIDDIDIKNGFIKVLGKGSVERYTPIGSKTISAISKYLKLRVNFTNKALFISSSDKRLSVRSIQYIVKKVALASGIDQHVHPHMLRHSSATHFLQSSHDLAVVQKFLGHKSIKSTQRYTHLDYLELAKTYDKYHPRAKK